MNAVTEKRSQAIRFWERRRVVYNLILIPPALLGWFGYGEIPAAVGDEAQLGMLGITLLFFLAAIGANVCFSFVYALEFVFLSDSQESFWTKGGRAAVFILGCFFAIGLAFMGGKQIGFLEFNWPPAGMTHQ